VLDRVFSELLNFEDTHDRDDIAYPRKPDISGVFFGHYASPSTVVVVFDLKRDDQPLSKAACGQVIDVVRRIQLAEKREVWGFAMNATEKNFVFQLRKDGSLPLPLPLPLPLLSLSLSLSVLSFADLPSSRYIFDGSKCTNP